MKILYGAIQRVIAWADRHTDTHDMTENITYLHTSIFSVFTHDVQFQHRDWYSPVFSLMQKSSSTVILTSIFTHAVQFQHDDSHARQIFQGVDWDGSCARPRLAPIKAELLPHLAEHQGIRDTVPKTWARTRTVKNKKSMDFIQIWVRALILM